MVIYKELEVFEPLYVVKLENGVMVYVYENHAVGSDGKAYRCVEEKNSEDEYRIVGWRQV